MGGHHLAAGEQQAEPILGDLADIDGRAVGSDVDRRQEARHLTTHRVPGPGCLGVETAQLLAHPLEGVFARRGRPHRLTAGDPELRREHPIQVNLPVAFEESDAAGSDHPA